MSAVSTSDWPTTTDQFSFPNMRAENPPVDRSRSRSDENIAAYSTTSSGALSETVRAVHSPIAWSEAVDRGVAVPSALPRNSAVTYQSDPKYQEREQTYDDIDEFERRLTRRHTGASSQQ